jgi:hypothetical protein
LLFGEAVVVNPLNIASIAIAIGVKAFKLVGVVDDNLNTAITNGLIAYSPAVVEIVTANTRGTSFSRNRKSNRENEKSSENFANEVLVPDFFGVGHLFEVVGLGLIFI